MSLEILSDNCYKVNNVIFVRGNRSYCYVINDNKATRISLKQYNDTKTRIIEIFASAIALSN